MSRRTLALALVASVLGMCCASGEELQAPALLDAPSLVLHDAERPCGLELDPVLELAEATQLAADRWSAATGCAIVVNTGGVQVRFATDEELTAPDGRRGRGVTHRNGEGAVEFIGYTTRDARLPWTVLRTLTHEVGHALGCWGHTNEGGASVLDEQWSPHAKITDAALMCVCNTLDCRAFNPEPAHVE